MFDRLIDLILAILDRVRFMQVVPEYEAGVVLRLGRYRKTVGPGVVWLIPFADDALTYSIVPTTDVSDRKDFTIRSGRTVSVQVVATWRVVDVQRFLLGVSDHKAAVIDALVGTTGEVLESAADNDNPSALARRIRRKANARARVWGIQFDAVQFGSFVTARTYRLIGDSPTPRNE